MKTLFFLGFLIASIDLISQDLRIYHIDVNQADATLFVISSGETLLIDSGNNGDGDVIKDVMDQAGVSRIDHFVTTHYHADHYGGIDALIFEEGVTVVNGYDRGGKEVLDDDHRDGPTYTGYDDAIGYRATSIVPGDLIQVGSLIATCVASGGIVDGQTVISTDDENDLSVGLLIEFNGFRYFNGGDMHKPIENALAASGIVSDVDIYQANHHGSNTSSAFVLLDDMMPTAIIISNGNHNGYGHPRQITLDSMRMLDPEPDIFQLNRFTKSHNDAGNVPDQFISDIDPSGNEGTILVEVFESNFTVSFGNVSHSYDIKNPSSRIAPAVPTPQIFIQSLVPNPIGDDRENEEVVLTNTGANSVSLIGWQLIDISNKVWNLIGVIQPNSSLTITRNRRAMSLNNNRDHIRLLDNEGNRIDELDYEGSTEGERISRD